MHTQSFGRSTSPAPLAATFGAPHSEPSPTARSDCRGRTGRRGKVVLSEAHWQQLHAAGVRGFIVTAPDPFSMGADRAVLSAQPQPVESSVTRGFVPPVRPDGEDPPVWRSLPASSGLLGSWVTIPLPTGAGGHFEVMLVGDEALAGTVATAVVFWEACNLLATVKRMNAIRITERERECLALAFKGYTDQEVGHQLTLSSHTVRYHLKNAMDKLHARSTTQAIYRAHVLGLL